ncbi:RagB/SusD family nutrient uptake outer membrane protein [uncultured Croceitalea sp.]|uniref:RagB/SusD family nutrient uptake outer membrane protein n=1 Tax=uncultured Croceitalea sp. TaxID=1798908 RepID=UPI00374EF78E
MKIIKYSVLVMLALFIVSSCTRENYLDFEPKGLVIPNNLIDYRLLLDNISEPIFIENIVPLTVGFGEKHGRNVFMSDNLTLDEDVITILGLSRIDRNTYLFAENSFTNQENDRDWDNYYNQIYAANVIIDGLSRVEDGTAEEIAELVGEAKLHRAYAYFNLVNLYGLHYNPASAGTDLGVPIRKGIELENVDLTRASVQEVYDFVIADITESIDALPDVQALNKRFRPSKAAAFGLLSKVYLYQARYDEALEASNGVLGLSGIIRDINDDEFNSSGTVRLLPSIQGDLEIIWFKNRSNSLFASDELIDLYAIGDLRMEWFTTVSDFFGIDSNQFILAFDFGPNNQADGIQSTDMYLIRAECNARLGNLDAANADLNALRINRFDSFAFEPLNITDQATLIQFVKDERRREKVRSLDRTFDIKRYNLFDNDQITVSHTLDGITTTLLPNSKNWAMPIAPRYILFNPEIEQNPRD